MPYNNNYGTPQKKDDWLVPELRRPQNWRALANPQVDWPEGLDPQEVLTSLSKALTLQIMRNSSRPDLINWDQEV